MICCSVTTSSTTQTTNTIRYDSHDRRPVADRVHSVWNTPNEQYYLDTGDPRVAWDQDPSYPYGEVQRPGAYRLEKEMTVMQALSVGGGLNVRGTERGIRINRQSENGKVQTFETKMTDLVQENDVIYVKESLF